MKKRLISLFIIAAMLIGAAPLGAVPGAYAADIYTYSFTNAPMPFLSIDYTAERDWKAAEVSSTIDTTTSDWMSWSAYTQMKYSSNSASGEYIALKLRIRDSGTYTPALTFSKSRYSGANTYVYMFPASVSVADGMTTQNRLGSVNFRNPAGNQNDIVQNLSPLTVPEFEGDYVEYYLVFKNRNAGSAYLYLFITSLTLDGSAIDEIFIEFDEAAIGVGEKTQVSTSALLTSGADANLENATVKYTSEDPLVATINQTSGLITAVSEGSVNINVAITYNGATYSEKSSFTVDNEYKIEKIQVDGDNTAVINIPASYGAVALLKNGDKIVLPQSSLTFSLISETPTGTMTVSPRGVVNPLGMGTASISVTAVVRGVSHASDAFAVSVAGKLNSSSIITYDLTGSSNVKLLTEPAADRNWRYLSSTVDSVTQLTTCMQIGSTPGQWVALLVDVPERGHYNADVVFYGYYGGGRARVYMIPSDAQSRANVESYMTEANCVGEYVGYAPAGTVDMTAKLDKFYATRTGEYILVIQGVERAGGSDRACVYIKELHFVGTHVIDKVSGVVSGGSSIESGTSAQISANVTLMDGSTLELPDDSAEISYITDNPSIVAVNGDTLIAGKVGSAHITTRVTRAGVTIEDVMTVNVTDLSEMLSASMSPIETLWLGGKIQLAVFTKMASGNTLFPTGSSVTYSIVSSEPENAASIDENGIITGLIQGVVTIKASVTLNGKTLETEPINANIVKSVKSAPSLFTQEVRDTMRENASKYTWAKTQMDAAVKTADKYVGKEETFWNMVVAEGLPRWYFVAEKFDPNKWICSLCHTDLNAKFGNYPWRTDPFGDPYKIVCPECKRRFPSNDFGSYYKSGLNEHGIFDKTLANRELLVNQLYPELGDGWGVDDGFGYFTGVKHSNGIIERRNYIAYYLHEAHWNYIRPGVFREALMAFKDAYLFTGEAKYARTGAILLDRIADLYPDYDWYSWRKFRPDVYPGKMLDCTWGYAVALYLNEAYDAFYPIYDDEYVVDFLSKKAETYKLDNPKNTPALIRKNAEDNIVRQTYKDAIDCKVWGNFGSTQKLLTTAAIVIDSEPETTEWIDFVMAPDTGIVQIPPRTGMGMLPKLIVDVDRDGNGNEAAPGYNSIWIDGVYNTAELLHNYGKYKKVDLYQNPKFAKMFATSIDLTLGGYYTAAIADWGGVGSRTILLANQTQNNIKGFQRLGITELAQILYEFNDKKTDGLHLDAATKDPEKIQEDIKRVVKENGDLKLSSKMLTGYGFAVLRDGAKYDSVGIDTARNTTRDYAIYFGRNTGHGHRDNLTLHMSAFGLNFAPDTGYPEQTDAQPNRLQWVSATMSHNTVVVDKYSQNGNVINATPYHFDDSGKFKLMDIDSPTAYAIAEKYRRTLVVVEANDEVSYALDFFRVKGGDEHVYSFHAMSDEIFQTENLDLVRQTDENGNYVGTYAGADVPWGQDPLTNLSSSSVYYFKYKTGSTWMYNVRRDDTPAQCAAVDFKIKDFFGVLSEKQNLHLRVTMLNSDLDELALTAGKPPLSEKYLSHLEYMLASRKGKNLDTLFTAVYEPYKDSRYLKGSVPVEINAIDATPGKDDVARAVKVEFENGRVDYVVYATNNTIKYRVADLFDFRGFVGVYSTVNGEVVDTYLNDGDIIGDSTGNLAAYTGTIDNFTRDFTLNNSITVNIDGEVDTDSLAGKYIYIDNSSISPENGAYHIKSAKKLSDGKIELDIGDITLVRTLRDVKDMSQGYIFNIESGLPFRIPMPTVVDNSPVFDEMTEQNVDAGTRISFSINAKSPLNKALSYSAVSLPRGADFNPDTKTFSWIPDTRQLGINHVVFEVSDDAYSTALHVDINVLSATGGGSSSGGAEGTSAAGASAAGASAGDAGAGGASAGGAGAEGTPSTGTAGTGGSDSSGTSGGVIIPPSAPISPRFNDLLGFEWSRKAIESLAEKGIIKGINENEFAPGRNIIRADFAILLTRAFSLTGEAEQFADVKASDYFAQELIYARASGIFTGAGNNLACPRANITREDMFVMIARALKLPDGDASSLDSFTDAKEISLYAVGSIAALVKGGYIKGSDGRINPKSPATRAEVAVLLDRVL